VVGGSSAAASAQNAGTDVVACLPSGHSYQRITRLYQRLAAPLVEAGRLSPDQHILEATLGFGQEALVAAASVGRTGSLTGLKASPILSAFADEGLPDLCAAARHGRSPVREIHAPGTLGRTDDNQMTAPENELNAQTEAVRIEACIINHNTSEFAELAVRSLVATHPDWMSDGTMRLTVVDNHSSDGGLEHLRTACRELNVGFELSRWPAAAAQRLGTVRAPVNTHGDVLRDFVAGHEAATHFLFLDTDVYFLVRDTVGTMLAELTEQPDVWAVQARFAWAEEARGRGASLHIKPGPTQQIRACIDGAIAGPFTGPYKPRCHPAVALVANTAVFRKVAEIIGLSGAIIIAADPSTAGFADTFGLASLVMQTHSLRYALSEVTVGHYFGISYEDSDQPIGGKLDDCRRRLAQLRS
jgi:hypothetical protein